MTLSSLHLITSDRRRGAEVFAVELVSALRARGGDARLMALHPSETQGSLNVPVLGSARRSVSTSRALRRVAKDVDVVVAHGSSTLEACAISLARHSTPFVYRTIGEPSYWIGSALHRRAVGTFLRRAARNVVLWAGAGEQLVSRYGVDPDRLDVIPNAVPRPAARNLCGARRLRRQFGVPDSAPCVAFVGALSPEKDVSSLIRATASIDFLHLLIAGDGPERAVTQRLAAAAAPGRVHHLGTVEDPTDVYLAVDLLALPSRSEGLPGVVIEAGLLGIATVASAVGGVPEMLDDGRTGFLVSPSDPAMLATAIAQALPKAERVGRQAAETFAMRFTIDRVVQQWEESMRLGAGH